MKTEYEVRILDIDVKKIKAKLASVGAKKIVERNMRRYIYDLSKSSGGDCNKWIRLRNDGKKSSLTIKEIKHSGIDGTEELEIEVGDFDKTCHILKHMGFNPDTYQENRRISYKLGSAGLEIDSWPKIPPFLEIEAPSIKDIAEIVAKLGLKMSDTTTMPILKVYNEYGIDLHTIKELKLK